MPVVTAKSWPKNHVQARFFAKAFNLVRVPVEPGIGFLQAHDIGIQLAYDAGNALRIKSAVNTDTPMYVVACHRKALFRRKTVGELRAWKVFF